MEADVRTATTGGLGSIGALAICGLAAGPLFLSSSIIQGLTRDGFDLAHQPVSFLSLGQLGWMERSTFIAAGALVVTFAIGILRARGQGGHRLEALFLLLTGLGVIIAGLFPPDAGFGYPVGTPDGRPETITYHSHMHGLGFTLSFVSFVLACIVNIRFAARNHAWRRVTYTSVSALAALALALTPGTSGIAIRNLLAAVILWAWITQRAYISLDPSRPRAAAD